MNIFYLDENVGKCAQYHCDKHVIKMILETTQLLSTAHHATGGIGPYKQTHVNHPSAKWARENISNYMWLCELGLALCQEYTARYSKAHKCEEILYSLTKDIPNIPKGSFSEPPACVPDSCIKNSVVESYREYYIKHKSDFAKWKNGNVPDWFSIEEKWRNTYE